MKMQSFVCVHIAPLERLTLASTSLQCVMQLHLISDGLLCDAVVERQYPAPLEAKADRLNCLGFYSQNPMDMEIYNDMDAWLHCMREPDKFVPAGIPRMLSSESDFTNPMRNDGGGVLVPQGYAKEYDFIYINQVGKARPLAVLKDGIPMHAIEKLIGAR
eukprot:scaffold194564_cov49-Prasinocladus_malaysianus.AAC.1